MLIAKSGRGAYRTGKALQNGDKRLQGLEWKVEDK